MRLKKMGGLQNEADAQQFLECMAESSMSTWCWPDCSHPQVLSVGLIMRALGYDQSGFGPGFDAYASVIHPEDRPRLLRNA